jgi:hypothetical protein
MRELAEDELSFDGETKPVRYLALRSSFLLSAATAHFIKPQI